MRAVLLAAFLIILASCAFAQNNQTESLTITTYYPAPYGTYRNPRLFPLSVEPASTEDRQPGTIYFNGSDKRLYVFSNISKDFEPVGSGGSGGSGGTGFKIYSGHLVSPDQCGETRVSGFENQLCTWDGWYKTITFPGAFNNTPHVIVVTERNPDFTRTPCADNMTDSVAAYADQITKTGFRIWGHGSPDYWSTCGHPPYEYEGTEARAEVGWIAIGQ